MPSARFLLLDIGNTTTKLRLANLTELLGQTRHLLTARLTPEPAGHAALRAALDDWTADQVLLSSVVPAASQIVETLLPNATKLSPSLDIGVDLHDYPGVVTLGADRLANLAGALALHGPGPLIVVDFGTAATFNALDASGRFLGGIIAPGLAAVRDYLPMRGAQLPAVNFDSSPERAIGQNTREAILAGTVIGYRGMVRELLTALRVELAQASDKTVRVIATGGDATWVAGRLPGLIDVLDPDLTLHGLRIIATRIFEAGKAIPAVLDPL